MNVICPRCAYSHSAAGGSTTLVGWQEIADHLRVSRSTAHRYYKVWNMPIERTMAGGHKVRTTMALIDAWLMTIINAQRKVEAEVQKEVDGKESNQQEPDESQEH